MELREYVISSRALAHSLMSVWFSSMGSRQSLSFPVGLGTGTKLLHHSDVSSTPRGTKIWCFCNWSSSSLKSCCNVYGKHPGSTWHVWPHLWPATKCSFKTTNACKYIFELFVFDCVITALFSYMLCFPGLQELYLVFNFATECWINIWIFVYTELIFCALLINLSHVSSGFYCAAFYT